jgi:hypothetical protein
MVFGSAASDTVSIIYPSARHVSVLRLGARCVPAWAAEQRMSRIKLGNWLR